MHVLLKPCIFFSQDHDGFWSITWFIKVGTGERKKKKWKESAFCCKHKDTCLSVHTSIANKLIELFTCIHAKMQQYSQYMTNISGNSTFCWLRLDRNFYSFLFLCIKSEYQPWGCNYGSAYRPSKTSYSSEALCVNMQDEEKKEQPPSSRGTRCLNQ